MLSFLTQLEAVIHSRKEKMPEGSYATSLFKDGLDRILRKIGEESGELIIAAKNQDKTQISNEAADLLFHMIILLHQQGMSLTDVVEVLRQRHE